MEIVIAKRPWVAIVIALLLVAIILLLGDRSFRAAEKAASDEFNQRQLVLAKAAAAAIELFFDDLAGVARTIGRIPEVQGFDEAVTRREMQRRFEELQPLGVNDIAVLDAKGVLRYNVAAPQIEGLDFSWRRYYQTVKRTASSNDYVVEFIEFKGAEAGQSGVLVAVPMFETASVSTSASGALAGVVVCTLRLDTVTQRFIASIRSSERGRAFLIDDDYNVLWSVDRTRFGSNLLEKSAGFPRFQRMIQSMSAGNSGMGEYTYLRFDDSAGEYIPETREEILVAYDPIRVGSRLWAIGVWAPLEDARQLIRSFYTAQTLVLGSCVLAILLGCSYALLASIGSSRILEREVDAKTGELRESHERLTIALNALQAEHAFQQSIIDGVGDAIMVIGPDRRVRLMNRTAAAYSAGDVASQERAHCYQITHHRDTPCDGAEHPCPLEQVRATGESVTVLHQHHHATEGWRCVEAIASPLYGADGAFQGIVECLRDVTERVRLEEEQRQYVQRLRALSARLADVSETERQRLARELHDQVGQNLTALGINLNIIRSQAPAQTPACSRLDDSLSLVKETTARIRDVMADLRPPMLDDYGLVAALRWYGELFAQRTGLPVDVAGQEIIPRPNGRVENALFRIAQEALMNVAKHAQATAVTLALTDQIGMIRLVVSDNGIGFDPEQMGDSCGARGWGLLGMSERAEAVGGHCRIESKPGRGTHVIVDVPRDEASKL